jgi:hypothetical protein
VAITYAVGQRWTAVLAQQLADYTVNRPLVRLVAQSAQSISDNTHTAVTFGVGSTVVDTHGYHSETVNSSRVTPLIAGWYKVSGGYATSARADYVTLQASLRLNGSNIASDHRTGPNATSTTRGISVGPIYVELNGSTDYVEIGAYQDNTANAAANTAVSGSTTSTLQVEFVRPSA